MDDKNIIRARLLAFICGTSKHICVGNTEHPLNSTLCRVHLLRSIVLLRKKIAYIAACTCVLTSQHLYNINITFKTRFLSLT